MNGAYTSADAVRIIGASYRQISYWTTRGWVTPSISKGIGTGNVRWYSYDDLIGIAAMYALCNSGVIPKTAARVLSGDTGGPLVTIHIDMGQVADNVTKRIEYITT